MDSAKKTLIYFIFHTAIGVIALLVALLGHLPDEYREGLVSGITGGFIITGVLGIISSLRLMRNPEKAAQTEMAKNEERTQFIRMKTYSAVYSISLYTECIGTLAAGLLGFREVSIALAGLLIVQLSLFAGFAHHYSKKY